MARCDHSVWVEVFHHQTDQRNQRHEVINCRPQEDGGSTRSHREEQQERDTGMTIMFDPQSHGRPSDSCPHTQGKKQQNRHDIEQPLPICVMP